MKGFKPKQGDFHVIVAAGKSFNVGLKKRKMTAAFVVVNLWWNVLAKPRVKLGGLEGMLLVRMSFERNA